MFGADGATAMTEGAARMTILRQALFLLFFLSALPVQAEDALPSWNDGPAKQAILGFVAKVTRTGGPGYVKPEERIAVFDNDGTLWTEWPVYSQLYFALDRIKALSPSHPEWKKRQPFRAALTLDLNALAATGEKGLLEIVATAHAGNTTEEFKAIVAQWLETAEHPKFKARYDSLVYQPMLELLAYLRANGFKTYIVSGGGVEFMRAFAERVYGVPPEQVVGSSIVTKYALVDGRPVLKRDATINFIDDKEGKPVAINQFIGKRPIAAFGNSDGDFEMLEWTTAGPGPRLGLLVHHDDAQRETAYDRNSPFGKLARGLDDAANLRWVVTSMQKDWNRIFPHDSR